MELPPWPFKCALVALAENWRNRAAEETGYFDDDAIRVFRDCASELDKISAMFNPPAPPDPLDPWTEPS